MQNRLLYKTIIALLMVSTLTCNLVMVTFLQRFFYGDLKVEDAATLHRIASSLGDRGEFSYVDYNNISTAGDAFDKLSATYIESGIAAYLGEQVLWSDVGWTSGSFGDLLGTLPLAGGRFITPDDDRPGAQKVVTVSQTTWEKLNPGKPFEPGSQVFVKGRSFEVVGVIANKFPYLDSMEGIDIWAPLRQNPTAWQYEIDGFIQYQLLSRLDPGKIHIAGQQLELAMADVMQRLNFEYTAEVMSETDFRIKRRPGMHRLFVALFVVTGFLFILGTVNQLLMLVTRSVAMAADLKVMAALGAQAKHVLIRFLRGFTSLISIAALGVGICSILTVQLYNHFWGIDYGIIPLGKLLDPASILFLLSMLVMLIALHVCFPFFTFYFSRDSLVSKDRAAGSRFSTKNKLSIAGVVFQIALVTVCILGCGAFLNSLQSEGSVRASSNEKNLLCLEMALASQEVEYSRALGVRLNRIGNSLLELGGVEAFSTSNALPLYRSGGARILIEGQPEKEEPEWTSNAFVSPGYFETMGIEFISGRDFIQEHTTWPHTKYIINQAYADQEFPNMEPLGRRIKPWDGTGWGDIIGVVENVADSVNGEIRPKMYIPFYQNRFVLNLYLSDPVLPQIHGQLISEKIKEIDPEAIIVSIETIDTIWDKILASPRLGFVVLLSLSIVGLLLSLSGIYGYQSYVVALRQREFAIRHAIGQTANEIYWSEVKRGQKVALAGFALGITAFYTSLHLFKANLLNIHLPVATAIALSLALIGSFTLVLGIATLSTKKPKLEILMRE